MNHIQCHQTFADLDITGCQKNQGRVLQEHINSKSDSLANKNDSLQVTDAGSWAKDAKQKMLQLRSLPLPIRSPTAGKYFLKHVQKNAPGAVILLGAAHFSKPNKSIKNHEGSLQYYAKIPNDQIIDLSN